MFFSFLNSEFNSHRVTISNFLDNKNTMVTEFKSKCCVEAMAWNSRDKRAIIVDEEVGRLLMYERNGELVNTLISEPRSLSSLYYPKSVAYDPVTHHILAADRRERIRVFDTEGKLKFSIFGINDRDRFQDIRGMTTDRYGNIIVCNRGHRRIEVYSPNGNFLQATKCDFEPYFVCTNNNNHIHGFVLDKGYTLYRL